MAAFLVRALDLPRTDADPFGDDDGSVFEADIAALAAAGITLGCDPPNRFLSRTTPCGATRWPPSSPGPSTCGSGRWLPAPR
jgi:hypothetical protein